ncbi:ABC transporter ATP-binding protein [Thermococcus indicus]|uniref:ABC transporter ATP-binding protein n=1 Tax=Thermococcus indicus TaxID=2586643 RepID=A0A4Y5SMD6_9EURY|nr:ABC transporter ATP-binding protein [Thermococcus indicus]QDA31349.1 ABC transporter ATP-binding protein [Thermococcus indicus]
MSAVIEARDLHKYFGPIRALQGVTVEIPEGLTLILGPNGGGKSTFMKVALGLYKPTKGTVRLLGKDPWRHPEVRKSIGVAFDPGRFPKLTTGREWLEFIARTRGANPDDVEKAARLFGIEDALDRRIDGYSSGMVKRLSLAQAFVGEPEVVFLDEPLANLDFESVAEIVGIIGKWKGRGRSFVLISHIWEPFERLADYGVVISGGKVYLKGEFGEMAGEIAAMFRPPGTDTAQNSK